MAVRIRLKKLGRKHRPFFRLCAMDGRSPRDGRVIEELGTYDPLVPETDARAILNGERIEYWQSVGALPTPKAAVLIKKYGKDGTHLDQQQHALNRLAVRRSDAIATATKLAQKQAEAREAAAPPPEPEVAAAEESPVEAAAETVAEEATAKEAVASEAAAKDASAETTAETKESETASE